MSAASERFLDLATKPLAENYELDAQAREEISSKLKPDMDGELEDASKRFEARDCSKWRSTWVGLGLILFGLGLLGLSASMWLPKRHIAQYMLGLARYMTTFEEMAELRKINSIGLPVKEQMLIKNDFVKLQELYPYDPQYYAPGFPYECAKIQNETQKAPLALLERISKIDPDNGWWPYIVATVNSKSLDLVDPPTNGHRLEWKPEAQQKVDLSLRLFRQAAAAPRFESYQTAIKSQKIALLPTAATVEDCASNLIYISFNMGMGENLSFLEGLVATQAQQLADRKDIPAFKILLNEWIKLSIALANDFNQMNDQYYRHSSLSVALPPLLEAARKLELHDEVNALEKSLAILVRQSRPYPTSKANQQAFQFHGSYLTTFATRTGDCGLSGDYFSGRYPQITKERLKPNRRSEHAYLAQFLILPLGFLLLTSSACLSIFRYRNGKLCHELSGRFTDLFDRSDWLHCIGFGVLLPMFYFALIRYLTPFGGMEWNAGADGREFEYFRFVLLFLLMVSCSLLVLRRRLKVRMIFFESKDRRVRIGLILTVAGFVTLPLLGSCFQIEQDRFVRPNPVMLCVSLLVMGLLLIWLTTLAIRFLLGNRDQALRRHILSRLVARTMICAFALVCATLPLHRAEEIFWVKRDTVIRADPEHPAITRYEWEVIQLMKSELLEVLAPLEAISR